MRKQIYLAALLCFAVVMTASPARGQEMARRLTNQDIIDMAGLGLSDDLIIAKIRSMNGADSLRFDTSIEGLKTLKAAKVSDEVIKVMINPAAVASAGPAVAGAGEPPDDPNLPPREVGVYWKDGPTFVPVEGQAISQAKIGGRAGSIFTDGIRGQHWDAYLNGASSKNRVKDRRPLFYFYVADGSSASDFVLLKLDRKGKRRQFEIGSFGGVHGGKSGVKQSKEFPFKFDHVAIRTFKVTLEADLNPGEYAFFMGTGQQAMMASARGSAGSGGAASGRIYDFSVPD